ncbi:MULTISPECIES: class I SAM-dependent methyltransferase [Flavobacterium]|uniref:SAM-dependent methyltransferase n=2 Tax=Flavobacterium TaxID=237 RepID=A0AA94JNC9_9FLAO|nr:MULTISPECIES: SAM-dependent methyltransferase [Flavobacterium]OXA76502.1 SAM-dependent methyltransferase [Flavobacterium columnare NBRC 100251 = ATCC 23463]AMA49791.1 SAM-dependent methyltransferase [Flavobacterium covae]AND64683.1 SAM-dependent methyltransferase [Flavobacterium covae]MCH4828996.1 SAM-dependent methyltransferase [Flavobacterium columnare]MCH4833769.1 SAM-dependent methyltransferase [Flavobacterium columnare]
MDLNNNYWENRYQNNEIGWDVGYITQPLKEYIDQLTNKDLKILIPGGGNSYEFEYLIHKGFYNTYVLDYAKTPIENIKKRLPLVSSNQIICEDFFLHHNYYDLIIEQTFLCALPPSLRKEYVSKMVSLLNPQGKIAGLLFDFPLTKQGPPFGGSSKEYQILFSNDFYIKTLEPAYNSIKPRQNKELFFIFTKK